MQEMFKYRLYDVGIEDKVKLKESCPSKKYFAGPVLKNITLN